MKKFIDIEKDSEKFYINHYLDDCDITVKVPVNGNDEIVIEKFNLSKHIYLVHCD